METHLCGQSGCEVVPVTYNLNDSELKNNWVVFTGVTVDVVYSHLRGIDKGP